MPRLVARAKPKRAPKAPKPPKAPAPPKLPKHEQIGDVDPAHGMPFNKALLDRFILEYPRDWDASQALLRAGYQPKSTQDLYAQAVSVKYNVYVAQQIQKAQDKIELDQVITIKEVMQGLKREANYFERGALHAARVSALKTAGEFLGMSTKKVELTTAHRAGILVVPDMLKLDDWENRAKVMQAELKAAVRK